MRKILIVTFVFFTVSLITFNECRATIYYSDVPTTHWGYEAIEKAANKGYVNGNGDGTFKPDQAVSNAEFIKMLVVALEPNKNIENGEKWYSSYVNEAITKGLISNDEFPNIVVEKKMIRSDLAKVGTRALGIQNTDTNKWMYLATTNGLIKGTDAKGTLKETGTMTRAEAVTVIERVLKVKNGEILEVDKRAVSNAEILWHKTNIFTMLPQFFSADDIDQINMSNEKLTYKSWNGDYINRLLGLIVIDLSDKNDSNRDLLNGFKTKYYNSNTSRMEINNLPNSGYVILTKAELEIKKNSSNLGIVNGGYFEVALPISEHNAVKAIKLDKDNFSIENSLISIKSNQNIYSYSQGIYIDANKQLTGDITKISITGMIEFGNEVRYLLD